jgi:hypothetical protein
MTDTTTTVEDDTEDVEFTADILREQVEARRGPDDKTVIIFDYVYDLSVKKKHRTVYTFVAVWIEAQNKWYVTGEAGNIIGNSATHENLMTTLAKPNVIQATVVTEAEVFKP